MDADYQENGTGAEGSEIENSTRFPSLMGYLEKRRDALVEEIAYEARGAYKIKSDSDRLGTPFTGLTSRLEGLVLELGQVGQIASDIERMPDTGEQPYLGRAEEYIEQRLQIEQQRLESMQGNYPQEEIDAQQSSLDLLKKAQEELR